MLLGKDEDDGFVRMEGNLFDITFTLSERLRGVTLRNGMDKDLFVSLFSLRREGGEVITVGMERYLLNIIAKLDGDT